MVDAASLFVSVSVVVLAALATDLLGPWSAGILAAAPTGGPLALYLAVRGAAAASAGADDGAAPRSAALALRDATDGLLRGVLFTLVFAVCARAAAARGHGLGSTLAFGFAGWAGAFFFNAFALV